MEKVFWTVQRGPIKIWIQFSSVQSLSHVQLFAAPWTVARQASLSITSSRSLLKLMSVESVMSFQPSHPLSSPSPPACLQPFPTVPREDVTTVEDWLQRCNTIGFKDGARELPAEESGRL